MNIAWIGTGVMGKAMLQHFIDAGHNLKVFNRSKTKMENIAAYHATSIADCVADCDFVFTMVGYPADVEAIYFNPDGIINNCKANAFLIDMTTSSPALAIKIAKDSNNHALDAPVSGGDVGAKNATLSIMVGGDEAVFEKVKPLFELLGKSINYIGEAGSGQHCKMCNQIAVAGATAAYSEALIYMKTNNLDPDTILKAIAGGAAGSWQLTNMAPRVLAGDFDPGFFIKHFIKDMKIADSVMLDNDIHLKMLESVLQMYQDLANNGFADKGTQALIKYYDK